MTAFIDRPGHATVRVEPVTDESVVIHVAGEVDLATAGPLRAAVTATAADPAVRHLTCDLSGVTFLACVGLTVLLDAKSTLDARGAGLRVVVAEPVVERLFTITELTETLDVRSATVTPLTGTP